jgi:hypothetical protein
MNSKFQPTRQIAITLSALVLLAASASMARSQQTEETKPENVPQTEPAFFVHADVDRHDRVYREGEPLFITTICEQDAYLYVIYKQADGKSMLVYPNSKQKNNFVKARQIVQVPAGDDLFRWKVGAPYGKETIFVIAAKQPLEGLEDPQLREKRFNELTSEQSKNVAGAIKDAEPAKWARDLVEITTKSKTEPVVTPQARRYGVFFGVKNYTFREEALAATQEEVDAGNRDKVWDPDMRCAENNVAVMSEMLRTMGKLDDLKTYFSKDATKANLKYAVTQWLPSVSKPGDTVFIYWTSHGGQIADDDGDEADQKDEWLLNADYIDLGILKQLLKKKQAGKLDAALSKKVDELVPIAERAGKNADNALIRHTGVSDDLFGHWLQSLAGRQVVVILDSCYSGGFYVKEKSITPTGKDIAFDFLDGEANRLKDLGQQETALMSACSSSQVCYINHANDRILETIRQQIEQQTKGAQSFDDQTPQMFVFTYYLSKALATMESPADLKQVHAVAVEGMRGYFPRVNELQRKSKSEELVPHEAILYNRCTKPVIMKP